MTRTSFAAGGAAGLAAIAALALASCQQKPPAPPPPKPEPATAIERTHQAGMPAAYHEFRVVGDGPVYLFHYPMFASIHAYQVIVEAKLGGAETALAAFRKTNPGVVVTVSPATRTEAAVPERDDWVLPVEIKPGRTFNADLHWSPPGTDFADPKARRYIVRNVAVEVTRVVRKQMFYPDTPKSKDLKYLAVGKGAQRYLAHVLERYPDFDHVVRVEAVDDTIPAEGVVVTVRGRPNDPAERLKAGETVNGQNQKGRALRMKVVEDIGFEQLTIQH